MVDSNPYPRACNNFSSRVRHGALSPDGPLEEGQEDVRDGVDGPDRERDAAAVHTGPQWETAGLAFRHVGGAEEVGP